MASEIPFTNHAEAEDDVLLNGFEDEMSASYNHLQSIKLANAMAPGAVNCMIGFQPQLQRAITTRQGGPPSLETNVDRLKQEQSTYNYSPVDSTLGEIRVLNLHMTMDPKSIIRCSLTHHRLHEDANFVALSYVWGDPEPPRYIIVDGHRVRVRENLFVALQKFQVGDTDPAAKLWVDSLCINQQDEQERAAQIPLMKTIYSTATTVFAWLGEQADDSDLALELCADFETLLKENLGLSAFMPKLGDPSYDKHWKALGALLSRPYWSRVWTMQEILLSERVVLICGEGIGSWPALSLLLFIIDMRLTTSMTQTVWSVFIGKEVRARALARAYQARSRDAKLTFSEWLCLSRERQATDKRDHVFGILGLVDAPDFLPSYTKTTNEIFEEIVPYVIRTQQNLDILSACGQNIQFFSGGGPVSATDDLVVFYLTQLSYRAIVNQPLHGLPQEDQAKFIIPDELKQYMNAATSWAPDWAARPQHAEMYSLVNNFRRKGSYYSASGESWPAVDFSKELKTMIADGIYVDEVLGIHAEKEEQEKEVLEAEWNFWRRYDLLHGKYGSYDSQRLAFKSTAVLGRTQDGEKQNFTAETSVPDSLFGLPGEGQTHIEQSDWFDIFNIATIGRRFFISKSGFIGRVPFGSRVGDILVILLGGKVPFVLRKAVCGVDAYVIVGEAYVQGIMEGEMMVSAPGQPEHAIQSFRIL